MSTTTEDAGAVPVQRKIDITPAGLMAYEALILSKVTAPASGIAEMEARNAASSHPAQRGVRVLQLQAEADQVEAAMAVLSRISKRYGLPPATIMREGATGMRLAAQKLAEVA